MGTTAATLALIRQAQAGDTSARNQLVTDNERLIWKAVGPWREDAADLFQGAVLVGAFRAIARFDPSRGDSFASYLFTCCHRAIPRLRDHTRPTPGVPLDEARGVPDHSEGPEDETATRETVERVRAVLRSVALCDWDRELVALRLLAVEPATLEELAARWGRSRQAVEQREVRLLKRAKAELAAAD